MAEKELLISISVVTDDDTGMYSIGELDGCFSDPQLEYYLNMYGSEKLLVYLAELTAKVVEVDKKRRPSETLFAANSHSETKDNST